MPPKLPRGEAAPARPKRDGVVSLTALVGKMPGAWPLEQSGVLAVRIAPDLERPQQIPPRGGRFFDMRGPIIGGEILAAIQS
jgi:hypothetical protein